MGCLARTHLRQMETVQRLRQNRIIGRQQDETIGLGGERFRQGVAASGITGADDHQRAARQGTCHRHWIGQALVVGQ